MGLFKKRYDLKSDEELMQLLERGDQAAFGELYQRYSKKLHRYFYRMLRQDADLAADHTQDLFLHVMEKAHLFDQSKRFSTWIYTIASNRCKNVYRTWSRKPSTVDIADKQLFTKEPSPPEKLDSSLFESALRHAVTDLPEAQKTCFVLRYQEELSIKEIGEILECPSGTVKSRLHYALKALAKELRPFNTNISKS